MASTCVSDTLISKKKIDTHQMCSTLREMSIFFQFSFSSSFFFAFIFYSTSHHIFLNCVYLANMSLILTLFNSMITRSQTKLLNVILENRLI
jgi:hypothetical protein